MTANTTNSTRRVAAGAVTSDIYVVCYADKRGRDNYRTVIAGDADDARQAHLYHHPGDEIRTVRGPVAEPESLLRFPTLAG